jgi:putative ABC transport system permease protein
MTPTRRPSIRRFFQHELASARVSERVDDELRFHFDMTVEELMARGMSPEEARREAERRFGSVEQTRARLESIDQGQVRQRTMQNWWSAFSQDARYAIRGLRHRPGFALAVIITLGLGIGANATMFGVVDRLLLRPPAMLVDPAMTHRVYFFRTSTDGRESPTTNIQVRRYRDVAELTRSFSQTAGFFTGDIAVGSGESSREMSVGLVSASFWPFFGVKAAEGRFFTPDEDQFPGGSDVAVLGHPFWQAQYGGRRDAIGQTLSVGQKTYTIIGVTPEGFTGTDHRTPVVYIPLTAGAGDLFGNPDPTRILTTYSASWMEMLVRRKPGVSLDAATADLTHAFRQSYERQLGVNPAIRVLRDSRPRAIAGSIVRERGPQQGDGSRVALWVSVAAIVLLIACANVANLLLARALRRRREIAVRVALGVSRGRLISQLLTETMTLALLGGLAGLAFAHWGGGVLRSVLLSNLDSVDTFADLRILGFTAAATLVAGLIAGIVPTIQASRPDLTGALKAGGREGGVRSSRTRTTLLVVQGALSVVLLVGAGLFVRSLSNARNLPLGYDPDHVLYVSAQMRGVRLDSASAVALKQRLVSQAKGVAGVVAVGRTTSVPFYQNIEEDLYVPGIDSVNRLGSFYYHGVSPEYFTAMGTKILRGRPLTDDDRAGSMRAIVVSEAMGKKLWKDADPIGKCVRVGADSNPCSTVVGVAENIRRGSMDDTWEEGLQYYVALDQTTRPQSGGLFVRTRGDAAELKEMLRRELQRVMPGISYVNVTPLQTIIAANMAQWQLGATMFSVFGVLALLLAAVGLYSVIAYNVTQRSHELGVRVALGAQARDLIRMVVREGIGVSVAGLLIGGLVTYYVSTYVATLLFKVSPHDPAVYVAVGATLFAVALAASWFPALRASRVDANTALRAD